MFHWVPANARLTFFKINFLKKKNRNNIRVITSLDSDQAWCFVRPDLDPRCLQRLSKAKSLTYDSCLCDTQHYHLVWLSEALIGLATD